MPLTRRTIAAGTDGIAVADPTPRIAPLEWIIAVAVMIVQQSAFIYVPALLAGSRIDAFATGDTPNPLNTVLVAANGVAVGALCLIHRRRALSIARGNWSSVLLTLLVVASTIWSIHPDVTFRRGGGYMITVLTAVYLSSRFTTHQVMRVLSSALAVTAMGSIAFVLAYPQFGIIQDPDPGLHGAWRGVFTTKNPFGYAMAIGVFVECYIITGRPRGIFWHACLLACFFVLVVLSHSATALIPTVIYLVGTFIYWLWTRMPPVAAVASVATALLMLLGSIFAWLDPTSALAVLGKNSTLTGRTDLWPLVIDLIEQKPIFGWGYGALWLAGDNMTVAIVNKIGWVPPSAQDEWLQVTSQLGFVGLTVLLIFIAVAAVRGVRCILNGSRRLGVFMLMFIVANVAAGITEEMLLGNQTVSWVVLNILCFSSGLDLEQMKSQRLQQNERGQVTLLARAKPTDERNATSP